MRRGQNHARSLGEESSPKIHDRLPAHTVERTIEDNIVLERSSYSFAEEEAMRRKAEEHASDNAGPKMIQVSPALD